MRIKLFISYLLKDLSVFHIKEIADLLRGKSEIEEVMYWHKGATGNMIDFMNKSIKECHMVLLFCSKKTEGSGPQKQEWTAANYHGKIIIPIFHKLEHIPPLIQTNRGVEFDFFDFDETFNQIYNLVQEIYQRI